MKRFWTILGIILCIIFIPILIINITLIAKSYINPNEVPDFLGYKPFVVLSGSMEPNIMRGDIAIIKKCDVNTLKKGDIIAFRNGTSVITHRIVEITEDKTIVTKGDDNNTIDRYLIKAENIEGIFVNRIPKLGNFVMFLQTTIGTVTFTAIPFIIFFIFDHAQRKQAKKQS